MISLLSKRIAVVPIFDPSHGGAEYAFREGAKVTLADGEVVTASKHIDFIIPDSAKERCDQGIVKYIGPHVTEVNIGDYVIFSGYTGTLLTIDGEQLIVLHEDFVQATIEEETATNIPGLYFRGVDGSYYIATYEQAMYMIAKGFEDHPRHKLFKVRSIAPTREDYDRLKGGTG